MDIHVNEMNNRVQTTDSTALLSPELIEQLFQALRARLDEENGRQERSEADRRFEPVVYSADNM